MLQNARLVYELLCSFDETRAWCVLADGGHDWLRGKTYKRLAKGPTRPRRERPRCAPESSTKNGVLNTEPESRQDKAEIMAYRAVWELQCTMFGTA